MRLFFQIIISCHVLTTKVIHWQPLSWEDKGRTNLITSYLIPMIKNINGKAERKNYIERSCGCNNRIMRQVGDEIIFDWGDIHLGRGCGGRSNYLRSLTELASHSDRWLNIITALSYSRHPGVHVFTQPPSFITVFIHYQGACLSTSQVYNL